MRSTIARSPRHPDAGDARSGGHRRLPHPPAARSPGGGDPALLRHRDHRVGLPVRPRRRATLDRHHAEGVDGAERRRAPRPASPPPRRGDAPPSPPSSPTTRCSSSPVAPSIPPTPTPPATCACGRRAGRAQAALLGRRPRDRRPPVGIDARSHRVAGVPVVVHAGHHVDATTTAGEFSRSRGSPRPARPHNVPRRLQTCDAAPTACCSPPVPHHRPHDRGPAAPTWRRPRPCPRAPSSRSCTATPTGSSRRRGGCSDTTGGRCCDSLVEEAL